MSMLELKFTVTSWLSLTSLSLGIFYSSEIGFENVLKLSLASLSASNHACLKSCYCPGLEEMF
jgi:hypothetical protein